MAHRVGVCGSCRARFQIPATFTPNQARCRTCGGVVDIGPPQTSAPEAVAPAAPQPQPIPQARPAPAQAAVSREPAAPVAPAAIEPRAPAPAPAPVAETARPKPARSPSPVTTFAAPNKKRGVLVPALVAAGVLAVLVFGAFQLLGNRTSVAASTPPPSAENADAANPADPKAAPAAAEDIPAPR
jgi:hypothetical protein